MQLKKYLPLYKPMLKTLLNGLIALLMCISPLSYADDSTLLLLKSYDGSQDINGWLMSEKLDGIRAVWDGKQLTTRKGNPIHAPDWFIAALPPFAIDGELWTQRNDFDTISSIVRQQHADQRWQSISYNIFEVPDQTGGLLARLAILQDYLNNNPVPFLRVIPHTIINSTNALDDELDRVLSLKGEGLVVRKPDTPYQTGRSSSALKVKRSQDTECIVIAHKPGKGKYAGLTGALKCQLPSGLQFYIGSGLSGAQRHTPPAIGSQITFKYYGLTKNNTPRFPVFLRERVAE
jgi:DNA ligase-1